LDREDLGTNSVSTHRAKQVAKHGQDNGDHHNEREKNHEPRQPASTTAAQHIQDPSPEDDKDQFNQEKQDNL